MVLRGAVDGLAWVFQGDVVNKTGSGAASDGGVERRDDACATSGGDDAGCVGGGGRRVPIQSVYSSIVSGVREGGIESG